MKPNSVSISASNWDRSKPAESFKAFARQIHGLAKEMLIRDGNHAEMFFCLPLGGHGHVVIWNNNDRDKEAGWLRKHIAKHYVYGVVHVAEGWMRMAMSADDPTFRRVMAGEMRVSELKPDERQEVLMVSAQSRDGWTISWSDEILRVDGKPLFGACHEVTDFRGRFGKLFG
jgi:hypothetical protein